MTHHCIKPACGPRCCGCNGAISEEQRRMLVHALTGGTKKVYRNYFATTPRSDAMPAITRCEQQGLMVKYRTDGDMSYFMCTEKGAAAVKLNLPRDA